MNQPYSHPARKLGCLEPTRDARTLQLSSVLRAGVTPPPSYDWDSANCPTIPLPMFANDQLGDCVMAGRAHQTLRFEFVEQQQVIHISDDFVKSEYFAETGGADTGLDPVLSLNRWRKAGWMVAYRNYKIKAWAEVAIDPDEVKAAMSSDLGVGFCWRLPKFAMAQTDAGQPWDIHHGSGQQIIGGHYTYGDKYDSNTGGIVTWGMRQAFTWRFFLRYCDMAFAIFNANNMPRTARNIDVEKVEHFLKTVAA
jgi:hypothetical protein